VVDRHGRLLQRNDVVFTDNQDEINRSVSRIQSRIEFNPAEDAYSLFDDDSARALRLNATAKYAPSPAAAASRSKTAT